MTGSYFHLTNTIMKLLGFPLGIFISIRTKLTWQEYYRCKSISSSNNPLKPLEISARHLSPNKIKKILSDVFFAKYSNELPTFRYFNLILDDFQILQALYFF